VLNNINPAGRKPRAVVIGASGGIGAAFTQLLNQADWQVQALTRNRPEDLPDQTEWLPLDLTDEPSIANAAEAVSAEGEIDLVLIASGVLHDGDLQPEKDWRQFDADHMARVFAVNTTGPALVIKHFALLLPRQGKSAIAALSARVGSISDNRLGGWYAYRASKAALNQVIRTASIELARKRKHAMVIGLHPGTVATKLSDPFQNNAHERFTPEQSARYLLNVIDAKDATDSGKVFDWQGKEIHP
jgi:NAD(P)-dependent dehydrogenase (short-subunit alcohol dehydrogenase family)